VLKLAIIRVVVTIGTATAVVVAAPNARAAETDSDGSARGLFGSLHPEVAGRMTFGSALSPPPNGAPGPLTGLGYGVRAGVSYAGIYGGLAFTDYLTEGECLSDSVDACSTTHGRAFSFEGGYGRTFLRILTIRGQLGIGDYWTSSAGSLTDCPDVAGSACKTTLSHSGSDTFFLQPEALVQVALGPVLVGADASIIYMPNVAVSGDPQSWAFAAFMVGAQLGARL
jgi:hypothetical protein